MKNKVLLVDDSITIHRVIDLSIDTDNFEIIKVFSEETATQKLKETTFEFILLDYKLENTNITSYISTIKNMQPSAKIIILIGAFDKFAPEDLIATGANDYLVKPFDSQSLNTKLSFTKNNGKNVENAKPEVYSATEPVENEEPPAETPLNDNFIKNMAQADIERENTETKPQTPRPVNTGALFHDPSVNPSKTEVKGNQIPLEQRPNPFEDDEPEPEQDTFDPITQFEDLKLVPESDDDFILSPLDNIQNETASNTQDSGFAKEKTFIYNDDETPTMQEAEFGHGSVSAESDLAQENTALDTPSDKILMTENSDSTTYVEQIASDQTTPTTVFNQDVHTNDTPNIPQSLDESYRETNTLDSAVDGNSGNIFNYHETSAETEPEQLAPDVAEPSSPDEREINMNKTEETGFYHLNEDDIFNTKPVTQIFEEEILSLNSPEKENGAEKPLAQKFEEEILSVDQPREMQPQQTQTDSSETEFYDPANLANIGQDLGYTKNISQKFEEEILSIDTPNEENQQMDQDYTERNNIRETFDNEILSMSAPEGTDAPYPSDNSEHQQTSAAPVDDFAGDDFITKEFSGDIFPKDDIVNNTETVNATYEKQDNYGFDDEIKSIEESSDKLFTAEITQNSPLSENIFGSDTKTSGNKPSIMDETLDLDKLLEMDMEDFSASISTDFAPQATNNNFSTEEINDVAKDIDNEPEFSQQTESNFNLGSEDDFFASDTPKTPEKNTFSEKPEDADFDMVQMDSTPLAIKEPSDSILSGITVTISKEEIMKMLGNALDKHFLEKAVQEVLAQNMREIVRAVVPAIAEKFIKEEIEKLKDN